MTTTSPTPPRNTIRSFGTNCVGCGTLIPAETRYCAVCAKKDFNRAPVASIETAPQRAPAYAPTREGVQADD